LVMTIALKHTDIMPSEDKNFPSEIEAALLRLQEDMELIGYIASHDLLAPVRIMLQYCNILQENRSLFPEKAQQDALRTFQVEITHMRALLEGLQEYIRLETFVCKHVPVDTNEVVAAAIEMLAPEIKNTGGKVTYDSLPVVMGHRGRLTRVFSSLIDNAIKFHSSQPPKIHISAARKDKMWQFCIEDNGIGILDEHQEVIFRLFQRLHTAEAYPGYGIGLALSQKTIISHGGKMWVESVPQEGSRFYFTLPAAD